MGRIDAKLSDGISVRSRFENMTMLMYKATVYISRIILIMLLLNTRASALTNLEIKMNDCLRDTIDTVVCDFSFESAVDGSNTLTGGQYSQAEDNFGNVYDAAKVQLEEQSGMAVFIEMTGDVEYSGSLQFEGVDVSAEYFKQITMRFNDGGWKQLNIVISN